jgi:Tc toxin complex TcA C-terminal TcB-binding domain
MDEDQAAYGTSGLRATLAAATDKAGLRATLARLNKLARREMPASKPRKGPAQGTWSWYVLPALLGYLGCTGIVLAADLQTAPPRQARTTACAQDHQVCGGISGAQCCGDLVCEIREAYPDAAGVCLSRPDGKPTTHSRDEQRLRWFSDALDGAELSETTKGRIKSLRIGTGGDLRRIGNLSDAEQLKDLPKEDILRLQRLSFLSLVSNDVKVASALAKHADIKSLKDIQTISPAKLSAMAGGLATPNEAQSIIKRANSLGRVLEAYKRDALSRVRNRAPLYQPPAVSPSVRRQLQAASQEEGTCELTCDAATSIFSPAVYLIYLLDFLTQSFSLFHQKLRDVPVTENVSQVKSYVYYTNQILENRIANQTGDLWPNETVAPDQRAARNAVRAKIYDRLNALDSTLLTELFDSYVREFGTTRGEVKLVLRGSERLKSSFAVQHDLAVDSAAVAGHLDNLTELAARYGLFFIQNTNDLDAIGSGAPVTLTSVQDLEARLLAVNVRKSQRAAKRDYTASIADDLGSRFDRAFRDKRKAKIEDTLIGTGNGASLAEGIPTDLAADEYQDKLWEARGAARECVDAGSPCPTGSPYANSPLLPITELFAFFSDKIDKSYDGKDDNAKHIFAASRTNELLAKLSAERYLALVQDDGDPRFKLTGFTESTVAEAANKGALEDLREAFAANAISLSEAASLRKDRSWIISDSGSGSLEIYAIRVEGDTLWVYSGNQDLRSAAEAFAKERIRSEEELERQLLGVAEMVFAAEQEVESNKTAFQEDVLNRAVDSWKLAVGKAQTGFLKRIRKGLIALALQPAPATRPPEAGQPPPAVPGGARVAEGSQPPAEELTGARPSTGATSPPTTSIPSPSAAQIEALANDLFLDLTVDETVQVSPVAFTIARVQSFVQAVELGNASRVAADGTRSSYSTATFDNATWAWLKSFGIWHAAIMLSAYPENFLLPEILQDRSPELMQLKATLDEGGDAKSAVNAFQSQLDFFGQRGQLNLAFAEGHLFLFRHDSRGLYYSVLGSDKHWTPFRTLNVPPSYDYRDFAGRYLFIVNELYDVPPQPRKTYLRLFSWKKVDGKPYLHQMRLAVEGKELAAEDNLEWKAIPDVVLPDSYPWTLPSFSWEYDFGVTRVAYQNGTEIKEVVLNAFFVGREPHIRAKFGELKSWQIVLKKDGDSIVESISPRPVADLHTDVRRWAPPEYLFWGNYQPIAISPDGYRTFWQSLQDYKVYMLGGNFRGSHNPPLNANDPTEDPWDGSVPYFYKEPAGSRPVSFTSDDNYVRYVNAPDHMLALAELLQPYKLPLNNAPTAVILRPDVNVSKIDVIVGKTAMRVKSSDMDTVSTVTPLFTDIPITVRAYASLGQYDYIFGERSPGSDFGYLTKSSNSNQLEGGRFNVLSLPKMCLDCKNLVQQEGGTIVVNPQNVGAPTVINIDIDPLVKLYIEDYYLHMPILAAKQLGQQQQYATARDFLHRAYDPAGQSGTDGAVFPGFLGASASEPTIGSWLQDPFDPYASADLRRDAYLVHIRLLDVELLLDWADKLFTLDTQESVNRARELYELAKSILGLRPILATDCEIGWHTFNANVGVGGASYAMSSVQPRDRESFLQTVGKLLRTNRSKVPAVALAISKDTCAPPFKRSRLEQLSRTTAAAPKSNLGSLWSARYQSEGSFQAYAQSQVTEDSLQDSSAVTLGSSLQLFSFCIPRNPMVRLLEWRITANLDKIRTNRNFAGVQRNLELYATPVDPTKLAKQAAAGDILDLEQFIPSTPPPIYRYSFLLERAKYLVSVAQQLEGSMLAAIEKGEEAEYSLMKAKQDVRLERSNVVLQNLQVKESEDGQTLAMKQKDRAEFQRSHFDGLLDEGQSRLEILAGVLTGVSAALSVGAASTGADWNARLSAGAQAASSTSSLLSMQASFQRRAQEWKFQSALAGYDVDLASVGVDIASDRVAITEQERDIANLRLEAVNDTVEFLGEKKFAGAVLYSWMAKTLRKLYRQQLDIAISTAKAAQRALEFERQTSLDFIGYDYWDDEKKGLLGAEQLLADLQKMDNHRTSTATRKREVEKNISLASVAPVEFQKFKETGEIELATLQAWFDRDFPGHYMRLIRDVSVSVEALVPPNEGVHATLSNNGISRAVVGPPFDNATVLYRLPEAVAISSPSNGTGLFELRPDDPMLLPFEGSGVETIWRLEMPKGANRFDYDSIVDIRLKIRYTALEDRTYRDKVLAQMGRDEAGFVKTRGVRYFSVKQHFPDQWYLLHNPPDPAKPLGELDIRERDFAPNEAARKIKNISVVAVKSQNINVDNEYALKLGVELRSKDCLKCNADYRAALSVSSNEVVAITDVFNGVRPYGTWKLLANAAGGGAGDLGWLDDIVLVVDYEAKVHYGP